MERKLPIGIQSFEKLRTGKFLYVDKTEYIYRLAHNNVPYFLSRPRRFGKSLLLSTLKAYWEGKKELFCGLEIERLEAGNADAWESYPVFYFDFNGVNYNETQLEDILDAQLCDWEEKYGARYQDRTLGDRFLKLLELAVQKTGRNCVVLVDEYDKPLLETAEDPKRQEQMKRVLKSFFSVLKKADESIQFIFITGVTKFHKVSIFSDLNQLNDISLTQGYSALCGITEEEMNRNFLPELENLAKKQGMDVMECKCLLKAQYDGYHFHPNGVGVYNPYSLFSAFFNEELGSYWFETGTPAFLVKQLRKKRFDVRKFTDRTLYAGERELKDYTGDDLNLIPLLYQAGYLTISDFDRRRGRYTLCFPNDEVKYGFLESLVPDYVPEIASGHGLDIFTLDEYVENGDLDGIRNVLTGLFAGIVYTKESDPFEHYFQSVIYIVFTLLGKFAICEMHTFSGRIDCKVETRDYIYLFEFKRDDTAEAALKQIEDKDYALPFVADRRKVFRIGVAFDSKARRLVGWKVWE